MTEAFQEKLRIIHRTNRVLWAAVLTGMIVLVLVSAFLKKLQLFSSPQIKIDPTLENIFLLIVVGLLFFVFYLKRHYLQGAKLIERARVKDVHVTTGDIADFVAQFGAQADLLAKALILMRRYFMLVWSTANIILLFGFFAFLLAGQFQTLLIYAVVSIYSMSINFPSFHLIESCRDLLAEESGQRKI